MAIERVQSRLVPDPRVVRFHAAQEVESASSKVHPVTWDTDPFDAAVDAEASVPSSVKRWAPLLDAAYGYEPRGTHPRGFARRAPSAGALYPIEVLAVTAEGAFYYDFWNKAFVRYVNADAAACRQALRIHAGDVAFVLASVFWRSVQRYGVRGYRYCNLDAAHVTHNLLNAVSWRGGFDEVSVIAPSKRLGRALRLPHSVGLMLGLVVRGAAPVDAGRDLAPQWFGWKRIAAPEHCPLLNPRLERVCRFHDNTLPEDSLPQRLRRLPADAFALCGRRSARSFSTASLSAAFHFRLHAVLQEDPIVPSGGLGQLRNYVVRLRVNELDAGIEGVDANPAAQHFRPFNAAALAQQLRATCQDQQLAGEAACAVITGLTAEALREASPSSYREQLGQVGRLSARLAVVSQANGVGTTTIGGFSDAGARRLVGDDRWHPVAIQLFGAAASHGCKIDATSRVTENIELGENCE